VPCIIHCCSTAIVAVSVVSGAAVHRERKAYYRYRIGTSRVAAEHNNLLF